MKTRTCNWEPCGKEFELLTRGDNNRKYCSKECSKKAGTKKTREWREENPERAREFSKNWRQRNDSYDSLKKQRERDEILAALGGACVVCGVTKKVWLHVDYIPTCVGLQYRHSRGKKFILDNLKDFRILCANHHTELTINGSIEGTDITQ